MELVLLVITNLADADSARTMARALVERRLAACVNMLPAVQSVYRWRDAIEEAGMTPMSIHTGSSRVYVSLLRGGREEVRVYEVDTGKLVGTIADVSSDAKPAPGTPGYYGKGYGGRGVPTVTLGE